MVIEEGKRSMIPFYLRSVSLFRGNKSPRRFSVYVFIRHWKHNIKSSIQFYNNFNFVAIEPFI